MNDEELREQLKLICRMMNLKVHEIDVGNGETERIPAGCDFQAHNCADNRGYLMNLGKVRNCEERTTTAIYSSPSSDISHAPRIRIKNTLN